MYLKRYKNISNTLSYILNELSKNSDYDYKKGLRSVDAYEIANEFLARKDLSMQEKKEKFDMLKKEFNKCLLAYGFKSGYSENDNSAFLTEATRSALVDYVDIGGASVAGAAMILAVCANNIEGFGIACCVGACAIIYSKIYTPYVCSNKEYLSLTNVNSLIAYIDKSLKEEKTVPQIEEEKIK